MSDRESRSSPGNPRFETTDWNLILAAGESRDPDSGEALATLCRHYWYPIYAHIRHLGNDADAAQDLTQGFFAHLLEKHAIKVARPDRGRFRCFLKMSLRHYLAHERHRARAIKRGRGARPIRLNVEDAEGLYRSEKLDAHSPEWVFEQRWARTLLNQALDRLREEMQESPTPERFDHLEPYLTSEGHDVPYRTVAAELGICDSAVRVAVHRMRVRFGDLLRQEVARTVDQPDEVDDEIRYLFSIVGS